MAHSQTTMRAALVLAETLGFCAGYLGRNVSDAFQSSYGDWPGTDSETAELEAVYREQYNEGAAEALAALAIEDAFAVWNAERIT